MIINNNDIFNKLLLTISEDDVLTPHNFNISHLEKTLKLAAS